MALVRVDAGRDESLHPPIRRRDAKSRVRGADEVADAIDDELQDILKVAHARDRPGGLIDGGERRGVR
jgi:hypothetical protein